MSNLTFTVGGPSQACASIPLLDNLSPEKTKAFTVVALSDAVSVLLAPVETTITILDDDGEFYTQCSTQFYI